MATKIAQLQKQIDEYTLRLNKQRIKVHDLEQEIMSFVPRRKSSSSSAKDEKVPDGLIKLKEEIEDTNFLINSYQSYIKKYYPSTYKIKFKLQNDSDLKSNSEIFDIAPIKVESAESPKKRRFSLITNISTLTSRSKNSSRIKSKSPITTPRSNTSMKKKLDTQDVLPPISITNLDNKNPKSDAKLIKKVTKQTKVVGQIINRFFGTMSPDEIYSFLNRLRENNKLLEERKKDLELTISNLRKKKLKLESNIKKNNLQKIYDVKLISEGKFALSFFKNEKNIESDNLRSFQSQKRSFIISALKIATFFDLSQSHKEKPAEFKDAEEIFKKIIDIMKIPSIRTIFKLSQKGIRSKVSFSLPDTPSMKSMASAKQNPIGSSPQINIPTLSLASATGKSTDFFPGTRSTRRAFSALNSAVDMNDELFGNVNNDLKFIGKTLGHIFLDRYSTNIGILDRDLQKIKYNVDKVSLSPIFIDKVSSFSKIEVIKCLAEQYLKNLDALYLLALEPYEICLNDNTKYFMSFITSRDFLISKILDYFNDGYNIEIILDVFENILNLNDVVACWYIRDIILKIKEELNLASKVKSFHAEELNSIPILLNIPLFFNKMVPFFRKRVVSVRGISEIEETTPYIAYMACFSTFLNNNFVEDFHHSVLDMINSEITNIMIILTTSMDNFLSKCGLCILFQIGQFCPEYLYQCLEFQNRANSEFLIFLRHNLNYPTCIKAATGFFNEAFSKIQTEDILFHNAMFFHYVIARLSVNPLNTDIIASLLSSLITTVANRNQYTNDQLIRLNFLPFLMKNFELEAFNANQAHIELENQLKKKMEEERKNMNNTINIPTKLPMLTALPLPMPTKVSYLDIPKKKLPPLNLENPKLQLHFKPRPNYNIRSSVTISDREYLAQRNKYPIYLSPDLHVIFVQLMFALLIDHNLHKLDPFFCDPFPVVNRKPNILYVVMEHMEGHFNSYIIEDLTEAFTPKTINQNLSSHPSQGNFDFKDKIDIRKYNSLDKNIVLTNLKSTPNFIAATTPEFSLEDINKVVDNSMPQYLDYMRLLRLTVPSKFNPQQYSNGVHIASGAFGCVMGVNTNGQDLAVKILEKSRTQFDNPKLIEIYTEVTILEMCKGDRRVTQLYDYGCSSDSYYIVMEYYPTTLKSWRKSFIGKTLPIDSCLRIFKEFLHCATILTDHHINHFDIKCDNVMLDSEGKPAIGDFGESMMYNNEKNCYTLLNRGTEWVKSPEMLSIALNSSTSSPTFDRRRSIGAGPASDVWSIGCLFYELITGEYLFADNDWSRFFMRITSNDKQLLTEESLKNLPNDPRYKNFLEFILQRNVRRRPSLQQVISKFDEMFPDASKSPLPTIRKTKL